MNMPGFFAEATLASPRGHYRGAAGATAMAGLAPGGIVAALIAERQSRGWCTYDANGAVLSCSVQVWVGECYFVSTTTARGTTITGWSC